MSVDHHRDLDVAVADDLPDHVGRCAQVQTGRERFTNRVEYLSLASGPMGILSSLMIICRCLVASCCLAMQPNLMPHRGAWCNARCHNHPDLGFHIGDWLWSVVSLTRHPYGAVLTQSGE